MMDIITSDVTNKKRIWVILEVLCRLLLHNGQ